MEAPPYTQATLGPVASPLRKSTHVGDRCSQLSLMVKMDYLKPNTGTRDKHYPVRAMETSPHVLLVCSSDDQRVASPQLLIIPSSPLNLTRLTIN
ncbi:hypothetical protein Tco_0363727 [Tanacetum coccineum]